MYRFIPLNSRPRYTRFHQSLYPQLWQFQEKIMQEATPSGRPRYGSGQLSGVWTKKGCGTNKNWNMFEIGRKLIDVDDLDDILRVLAWRRMAQKSLKPPNHALVVLRHCSSFKVEHQARWSPNRLNISPGQRRCRKKKNIRSASSKHIWVLLICRWWLYETYWNISTINMS